MASLDEQASVERWSFALGAESAKIVERDVARALVVQNARFATRFDLMKNHRSPRSEGRRRLFVLGLCVFGFVLGLILLAGRYLESGTVLFRDIGLTAVFVICFFLFFFEQRLRQAWLTRIDGVLWRRAGVVMKRALLDAETRTYEIDDAQVRRVSGERAEYSLAELPHALIGEQCILLFRSPTANNPGAILLVEAAERDRVAQALERAGATLERLSKSLLPELNAQRRWS